MTIPADRSWGALTAGDVEALAARDPVAVLPLAAIEQHGPHLPLSTDLDIGEGILVEALTRLEADFPLRVLPAIAVGASMEHADVGGTLALSMEEAAALVVRMGRSVARAGVRRLVLANSHGGNRAPMEAAALELRREEGMLVVKASYPRFPRPERVDLPESEWALGIHGGAIETSMMLHLRPDLVRTDAIMDWDGKGALGEELANRLTHLRPEGAVSFAWAAGDLHPSGVAGDPRLADADTGARLVAHYGGILSEVFRDARAFPLDRLS